MQHEIQKFTRRVGSDGASPCGASGLPERLCWPAISGSPGVAWGVCRGAAN